VLLLFIDSHGVQSGAANARCKLGQSRAALQCTPTLFYACCLLKSKQHA